MTHNHAIVWMDSKEAHIFRFNAVDVEGEVLKAHSPFRKVHHKAGAIGSGHAAIERDFLDRIVDAVRGTTSWLLVGPGQAKLALVRHLEEHRPHDLKRLAGVEAMDHPTDGELLAHARRAFKAIDRMGGPGAETARAPH
jgi:stalled ribosome rescue protein Dom34